ANVFGSGNTYPDQITPIAPATGILTYNTGANIGAIRAQTANYKLVYFGVGPEQMADAAVGRSIIQLSHDWFYGTVGITEFDAAIGSLGQAYPVPANDLLNIPVNTLLSDATLEVFDAMGRSVMQQGVARTSTNVILNTSDLSNGVYSYRLSTATSAGSARSFVVSH
ncbi:MAG: T9SS type A sorting domain-containing protein, partial [Flavobacteriales bacterium]